MNDIIWQHGRTELLSDGTTGAGTAYSGSLVEDLLICFACNDFSVIKSFVPEMTPLLNDKFYPHNMINLFSAVYYKDKDKLEQAILLAEAYLKKKISGLAEYYVRFFLALAIDYDKKNVFDVESYIKRRGKVKMNGETVITRMQ